jgi:hypothetical protein
MFFSLWSRLPSSGTATSALPTCVVAAADDFANLAEFDPNLRHFGSKRRRLGVARILKIKYCRSMAYEKAPFRPAPD